MSTSIRLTLGLAVLWPGATGGASTAQQQERPAAAARSTDTAAVDRGRDLFRVNCGFCHGVDARSLIVLNDDRRNG